MTSTTRQADRPATPPQEPRAGIGMPGPMAGLRGLLSGHPAPILLPGAHGASWGLLTANPAILAPNLVGPDHPRTKQVFR